MTTRRKAGVTWRGAPSRSVLYLAVLLVASCSQSEPREQDGMAVDALKLERERQERQDNVEATKHLQNVSSVRNSETR